MRKLALNIYVVIVLTLMCAQQAQALPLEPGYDLYRTKAGSYFFLDVDGDTIRVDVQGRPIDGSLYNTDMIVERKAGADPFDANDTATIPIEIVALSLQSTVPVFIKGIYYDVEIYSGRLLADPLSPYYISNTIPANQDGSAQVKKLDNFGGTFSSFFDVFYEIKITDINDPNNSDKIYQEYKKFIENAPWVETPGHTRPKIPTLPSGNFYSGDAQCLIEGGGQLLLAPASTPEPLSLVLMGGGLMGLFGLRRRSRTLN